MTDILIVANTPFEQWMVGRVLAESGILRSAHNHVFAWCNSVDQACIELRERTYDMILFVGDFAPGAINSFPIAGIPTFVISDQYVETGTNRFVKEIPISEFDGEVFNGLVDEISARVGA